MIPLGAICVMICMVWLPAHYWRKMFARDREYGLRWLVSWGIKGMVLPLIVWMWLNSGAHPVMPAVVGPPEPKPTVMRTMFGRVTLPPQAPTQAAPSGLGQPPKPPGLIERFLNGVAYVSRQTGPAIVVVSSYWAALTIGWFVLLKIKRMEENRDYVRSSLIWCLLALPVVAVMIYLFGLGGAGFAALFWVWPLMHHSTLLEPEREVAPVLNYGLAQASLNRGKYRDAEKAIIAELERCETDFDGWMMLAELYARQFDDLGEAERTVASLCEEPTTTLPQVSVALQRLADWQLQLGDDPLGARRALEEIRRRMPGTHLARMAGLRIDRLPMSGEELREQRIVRKIRLPALGDTIDNGTIAPSTEGISEEPLREANRLVDRLKRDPNDVMSRERLARVFAEELGQVDLAMEQVELLLEMPEQLPNKMAEWLGMMAAWQIRYRGNRAGARKLLQRLIQEHPQTVQAFAAQRRLSLLEMEEHIEAAAAARLGQPTIRPA